MGKENIVRIALIHTRLRIEERLLIDACEQRGITVEPIDLRQGSFSLADGDAWVRFDLVLDRSLSLTSSLAAVRLAEAAGRRCINASRTIELCADKMRTTLVLQAAGVPTPITRLALSPHGAMEAIETLGYPVVLKPIVGSWGRLIARINDRDAAEAIIEGRQLATEQDFVDEEAPVGEDGEVAVVAEDGTVVTERGVVNPDPVAVDPNQAGAL